MSDVATCLLNSHWIVLLPFLAGALIILGCSLFKDKMPKTLCMGISIAAVFYGFLQSLLIFNELRQTPTPYMSDIDWFVSDSFKITVGILVDNLASLMLIVVTLVSLLVQIYTHGYMREDPGYRRFYSYLSLFTGSMLGLVISTNLIQMFIFWELVGVCSYLLIGFWWNKPSAAAACVKAFVVNRIGDFGFLIGILLLLSATYGFWHAHADHGLLMFYDPQVGGIDGVTLSGAIKWALDPAHGTLTQSFLTAISMIMFLGPMAKSAQAPLHVWLPDAMEGPTPISALIHAATMVAAGIYMVARAYPIWLDWTNIAEPSTASAGLAYVAWIGGITAFMAATIALTQFDIKRALAWSTVSQLGYMFVGLGCGGYSAGMFHLTTHAFFKAMLFLCSGAVIHALHGEQDMRQMGGLFGKVKYTATCFLIGTLAISGVPGFAGFFSKDEIIGTAFAWQGPGHEVLAWLMVFTAGMTAYYMFRMFFMTFTGTYRGSAHVHEEHKPDPLTVPLLVLAVPSIAAGAVGADLQQFIAHIGSSEGYASPFSNFVHFMHPHAEVINMSAMTASTVFSLVGIALAFALYYKKGFALDVAIEKKIPALYRFSLNKWYWDELYMAVTNFLLTAFKQVWECVDKHVIDNIVNLQRYIFLGFGHLLKYSENGRGQSYALTIFAGVALIGLFVYFFVSSP
ncbi:MAG: NADH-quinone oxidoreductase subunit L [Candidatus Obscuribacterales bacterium]|nr:NADH-quinone oxidoreductase subunit L [Candidatus Obscuribacterales bacterium]